MKLNDKRFLLWCAYIIDAQQTEIYKIFSLFPKMTEEVKTEILKNHLCGFSGSDILIKVVKENFPQLYDKKKSFDEMNKNVKEYLEKI
jgi:hypothetical protein